MLLTGGGRDQNKNKGFRFLTPWVLYEGLKNLVMSYWDGKVDYFLVIQKFKIEVTFWNKKVFGFLKRKKLSFLLRVNEVQRALERRFSKYLK